MTGPTRPNLPTAVISTGSHEIDLVALSAEVFERRHLLFRMVGSLVTLPWRITRASVHAAIRIVSAMFALVFYLPWKLTRGVTRTTARISALPYRFALLWIRVMRVRGIVLFVVGFAAGVLLTPWPGSVLRGKIKRRIAAFTAPPDSSLADRVRAELASSPRTWHLRQPGVSVDGGVVTLAGSVSTDAERDALVSQASLVPGVSGVEAERLNQRLEKPEDGADATVES